MSHRSVPGDAVLLRRVIATLALTLLWTTMAGELQGQPSVRAWGVSVLLGVGSPDGFGGLVDGKTLAASGLIVDHRGVGKRLGYRVEWPGAAPRSLCTVCRVTYW